MELRDYQEELVAENIACMERGVKATLNHLFTGAGKTVAFVNLATRIQGRTLIIAHLRELVWQTVNKVREIAGDDCAVEMAEYRSNESEWFQSKIVVASKQTLLSKRGEGRRYEKFDGIRLVIVDEAHLMCSEPVLRMLRWFQDRGAMIAGFTATPFRQDGRPMMKRG